MTVKFQIFRREFETLKMKNEEIIQDYFRRVSILVKEMSRRGCIRKKGCKEDIEESSTKYLMIISLSLRIPKIYPHK